MKTKYILTIIALMFVPLVSAVPVAVPAQTPLDMVYLLVENTFGGILMTALGMIAMFLLLGMWSRMNINTIFYFCLLFSATFAIGWIGGIAAFIFGSLAIWYAWNGWKNYQNAGQGS